MEAIEFASQMWASSMLTARDHAWLASIGRNRDMWLRRKTTYAPYDDMERLNQTAERMDAALSDILAVVESLESLVERVGNATDAMAEDVKSLKKVSESSNTSLDNIRLAVEGK